MKKETSSKSKTKKILIRLGLGVLGLLLILVIAVAIVMNTVVTPQRITPILLSLTDEYIDANVKCESVDITLFSSFPDLGVKLESGSISSETDTLLAFDNIMVAVNPLAFIFDKKIIIRQLEIENADIYAHVDTTGKANWDIFISSDSIAKQDTTAFVIPELDIKNIRLRNVNLTYDDLPQDIFVMVDSLNMRLKGNLSKEQADLSLGIRTTGVTAYYQGQSFSQELPFSFRTQLKRDRVAKTVAIEKGTISVGTLELKTHGILKRAATPGITDVDVDFSLNASSLSDLVNMVPTHISDISTKLVAGGKIESSGKLTGQIGKDQYPIITLAMQLIDGTLASTKHPDKPFLEDFDVDINTLLDLSGKQASSLALNNLYLQTASSKLTAKGEFDDILTDPSINAQAKANINFTQMSQKLPMDGMKMGGQIDCDLSVKCMLNDVLASDFGKIDANGVVNIKNVMFNHPGESLTFYTSNANMALGTHVKDSVVRDSPKSLLRSKIVLDSLNLNWKDEIIANSSRVSALVTTTPPKDTSSIAPLMVGGRIRNIRLVMGDSIRMRGVHAIGGVNIRPRADKPNLPEISGSIALDTLMGRVYEMAGRISKATIKLKFTKQQLNQRRFLSGNRTSSDSAQIASRRNFSGRDTTLTRAQRDSLRKSRLDPTTNLSFQIESQETKDLLRKWEISGGFSSKDVSVRTPYFPIPIRMRESDMTFTSNTLSLKKAHMRLGQSDFTLKGEVDGIRRALLYNGKVATKMTLEADSIDFNEIIKAAITGSEYGQKSHMERDSISGVVLDEGNSITMNEDTTALGIFVVPRNLDIEFNSRIRNAKFNDITLKNARGRIILRDQAIHLPRLMINSDIGSAFMTMVYKAPNTKGAYLGMELGVKRIDVKELIEAMPMIDELAPMLRSFEGVVDCDMTAVTELDSMMNVRLPQTTASCYLSGQNLVLLDGETFSEISKMLMFKNKNRNVIDSLSVEMILEDEKLMIFPFQVSMDRYNAAVGGIQNLDMSFDYHITVLKSPVPFKLGLNISGNPDKMKIRLGKAKYKDMFTVARQKDLDNTTFNLRKEMDERLRQSINEIVGAELSQPLRRPKIEIPDSLKRSYFHLEDTVASSPLATETIPDTVKLAE